MRTQVALEAEQHALVKQKAASLGITAEMPTHTGAGRIITVRMRPMSLAERGVETPTVSLGALLAGGRPDLGGSTEIGVEQYAQEITSSGFPGIRTQAPRVRLGLLDAATITTGPQAYRRPDGIGVIPAALLGS